MKTTHPLIQIVAATLIIAWLTAGCGNLLGIGCEHHYTNGLVIAHQTHVTPTHSGLTVGSIYTSDYPTSWAAVAELSSAGLLQEWRRSSLIEEMRLVTDTSNGCIYRADLTISKSDWEARLKDLQKDLKEVDGSEPGLKDNLTTTATLKISMFQTPDGITCLVSPSGSQEYSQSVHFYVDEAQDQSNYQKPDVEMARGTLDDYSNYFLKAHFDTTFSSTILGDIVISSAIKALVADDSVEGPTTGDCS